MTRARCGRASGLPSRPIASWKPPPTRSAPSFHHSGSATSNSQRLSAAASLATSLMPAASGGEGPRSSPSGIGRSLLAGGLLAFFVLYCTKHRQPSANSTTAARSDGSITAPRERTYFEGACSRHRSGWIYRHARFGAAGGGAAPRLLADGHDVVGLDNLNAYYDPRFKEARIAQLKTFANFQFEKIDIADRRSMAELFAAHRFPDVVHLAAQAGVRHSLVDPHAYVDANLTGFLNVLEGCRHTQCRHL